MLYVCVVIDCKYLTLTEAEARNDLWKEGYFRVYVSTSKEVSGTITFLDGKQQPFVEANKYKDIIKGSHVKLDIRAEKVIRDLSSLTANRLFSLIRLNLKYQSDVVYISISEAMVYCKVKDRSAIYVALKELAKNKVIKKADTTGFYFINPFLIWKGAYPVKVIEEAKLRAAEYNKNKKLKNSENEEKPSEQDVKAV